MGSNIKIEITEDQIRQIETMASYGLTMSQISAILGIGKRTLERRVAENEYDNPIHDALTRGRATSALEVTRCTLEMIKEKKYPMLNIFWLKARCGWRDDVASDADEERPLQIIYEQTDSQTSPTPITILSKQG